MESNIGFVLAIGGVVGGFYTMIFQVRMNSMKFQILEALEKNFVRKDVHSLVIDAHDERIDRLEKLIQEQGIPRRRSS